MTRLFLTVHKWIGIFLGVLLFIWLASGIVMILPFQRLVPMATTSEVDITTVTLSPAEAAVLVRGREADSAPVSSFSLVVVEKEPYYRILLKGGRSHLISATTGEKLVIDRELAERLAKAGLEISAPVTSVTELRQHTLEYPGGTLPVWRVEFGDDRRTVGWVGVKDGAVFHDTRMRRLRATISQLHTFGQIRTLTGSLLAQHGTLAITSAIAILLVITGYYLVLPKRWRRRWERPRHGAA